MTSLPGTAMTLPLPVFSILAQMQTLYSTCTNTFCIFNVLRHCITHTGTNANQLLNSCT